MSPYRPGSFASGGGPDLDRESREAQCGASGGRHAAAASSRAAIETLRCGGRSSGPAWGELLQIRAVIVGAPGALAPAVGDAGLEQVVKGDRQGRAAGLGQLDPHAEVVGGMDVEPRPEVGAGREQTISTRGHAIHRRWED